MKLSGLLTDAFALTGVRPCGPVPAPGSHDPDIASVHYRAQEVEPGGLFVAVPGFTADGHDFIDQAVNRGAAAVVVQKKTAVAVPVVRVDRSRRALAGISAVFYGRPSEKLCVVGITGTNGKTTTAYLIEQVLVRAGHRVGVIGTIDYHYAGKTFRNPVTTPESSDLQAILAEMLAAGTTHVVMEISSHAIDLYRIGGCFLDVGVFTNLTQDHLDYHPDMQAYWACKKRLFTEFLNRGPKGRQARAVVNLDTEKGRELLASPNLSVIGVGRGEGAAVRPAEAVYTPAGTTGRIHLPDGGFAFRTRLAGRHNLENMLCAAGVGVALGVRRQDIKDGIEAIRRVPGRLEAVPCGDWGRFVYVDYAHTPDALENVILALKEAGAGRIICVFGCGGDRDRTKRPAMGEIAGRLCDLCIVTSDNPRTENPGQIIEMIVAGVSRVMPKVYRPAELANGFDRKGYAVASDRRQAIRLGIRASAPGDTILVAGKGHETYQIIGDRTLDFDDRLEAAAAIRSHAAGALPAAGKTGNQR